MQVTGWSRGLEVSGGGLSAEARADQTLSQLRQVAFACNPRSQLHLEIGRRRDRLQSADEFAQPQALIAECLTRDAGGHVGFRVCAQCLPQL